ncbi:MAG: hypothetical protein KF912_12075 [Phycisphaeraceae bacterium]|nr:hypothetical protein [Phycisphaeraceae bacterium]
MQWRIDVAPRAAEAIRALDPALRDEFIARIDAFATDPLSQVRRSLPPFEPVGAWVLEYMSEIDRELRVVVIVTEPDADQAAITLALVKLVSDEIDEPPV